MFYISLICIVVRVFCVNHLGVVLAWKGARINSQRAVTPLFVTFLRRNQTSGLLCRSWNNTFIQDFMFRAAFSNKTLSCQNGAKPPWFAILLWGWNKFLTLLNVDKKTYNSFQCQRNSEQNRYFNSILINKKMDLEDESLIFTGF